jgi:hypothetical protein
MSDLDALEEATVAHMHHTGGGNPLGAMGLSPVRNRENYAPETPLLVTPGDKREDCYCRGGVWTGGDVMGFCLPGAKPTGKFYDKMGRGCAPIPGWKGPITSPTDTPPLLYPWWRRNLLWIVAGVAVGGIVLGAAIKGR